MKTFNKKKFLHTLRSTSGIGTIAYHCLSNNKILTIDGDFVPQHLNIEDDLVCVDVEGLLKAIRSRTILRYRNLGKKTLAFIIDTLIACGVDANDIVRPSYNNPLTKPFFSRGFQMCCPHCKRQFKINLDAES